MDYSNFEHPLEHFSIPEATRSRLAWADSVLNSAGPVPLAFEDTFTGSKADETLSRETYAIPAIFTANGPAATELASNSPTSNPKYFSISDGQGLAMIDSLDPEPSIDEIMPEDVQAYDTQFEQTFCYSSYSKTANTSVMAAHQMMKEFEGHMPAEDSGSENTTELHTCTDTMEVHSDEEEQMDVEDYEQPGELVWQQYPDLEQILRHDHQGLFGSSKDYPILIEEDFDAPAGQKSPARRKSPREAKKATTLDKAGRLRYGNQLDLEALRTEIRLEWEEVQVGWIQMEEIFHKQGCQVLQRSLQKFEKTLGEGLKTACSSEDSGLCGQQLAELWKGVLRRLTKSNKTIRRPVRKYGKLLRCLAKHESVLYLREM